MGGRMDEQIHSNQAELKSFSRTLAEIEWLLLALVLVYLVILEGGDSSFEITIASAVYAVLVIGFRYLNLFTSEARWKLAVETMAMIALTAFVVWHTGKADSVMVNLFLLPIVFAALTLGTLLTLGVVSLIAVFYLVSAYVQLGDEFLTYVTFSSVMLKLAPLLLVAYLTALLAADMSATGVFLRYLSETDSLTGLPNMRGFRAAIDREHARAERERTPFTLMMVDADNLKTTNDRFGHEAGNRLIIRMVETMKHALRGSDIIARYGGDEFVVLLPNTSRAMAREAGERVRKAIAGMGFAPNGEPIETTVSVGLATFPDDSDEVEDLMSRADQAMYASKKSGRNRVTVYTLEPMADASPA
jgi:diguanylate cyclase